MGYGPPRHSLEAFLGSIGSSTSPRKARHQLSAVTRGGFAYPAAYSLTPGQPPPGMDYLPASPHRSPTTTSGPSLPHGPSEENPGLGWLVSVDSALAHRDGYGNINPLSIDYASRPRLRSRLTLGGLAWPRNPWSFGGRVSHSSFATHACILTHAASTIGSLHRFTRGMTLPYPPTPLDRVATAWVHM